MGIGGGAGLGGGPVPSQIRESTTTAFVETNKAALSIMPQDTFEVVPFTQQDSHMFLKYETKSNNPLLRSPLLQMRMAELSRELDEKTWQPIYDELVDKLPVVLKELLITENDKPFLSRNMNFVVLNNLLMAAARTVDWLGKTTVTPAHDTPSGIRNEINIHLSDIALNGAATSLGPVLSQVHTELNDVGSNFMGHDQISNTLNHLDKLLGALNVLNKNDGTGHEIALADATHRLAESNKKEGSDQFQILGAVLNTLDLVASSQALENGAPSILFGTHLSNLGSSSVLGSISDTIVDGLLGVMGSGNREQIAELESLKRGLQT